eukprot:CAMPEP_0113851080 /NCGR_PEP_ID=MMETSP0372-20130328/4358_1 /TAXON_ID=340204 /ORGANISM="Lankesteria abbotti" /LENGTH=79 /DNA_ID=CAMNT_0000821683 /DNA_START=56 /DNA_END=295 /DNA_ORIENTATION=+ /assembly_acc=CAM_ASM_000359
MTTSNVNIGSGGGGAKSPANESIGVDENMSEQNNSNVNTIVNSSPDSMSSSANLASVGKTKRRSSVGRSQLMHDAVKQL